MSAKVKIVSHSVLEMMYMNTSRILKMEYWDFKITNSRKECLMKLVIVYKHFLLQSCYLYNEWLGLSDV